MVFLGPCSSSPWSPSVLWSLSKRDAWVPLQTHQLSMHQATSSDSCPPVVIQLLLGQPWGSCFLPTLLPSCFLRWSLLHLPKPSMNGTEKPSFLPLTLYYHLTFPDGMSNSVKPPACRNCQTRSRHQALRLHMPQTPWSMSSLPRAPLHSPIHSISATGEWTACWLVGQ